MFTWIIYMLCLQVKNNFINLTYYIHIKPFEKCRLFYQTINLDESQMFVFLASTVIYTISISVKAKKTFEELTKTLSLKLCMKLIKNFILQKES